MVSSYASYKLLGLQPQALPSGDNAICAYGNFNGDGRPDVFVACHGYDASPFPDERNKTVLIQVPAVANEGVVLVFTVTGTGASRSLWVLRTSGGDGTFHQSRVAQKVAYPALTASIVLHQRPARWIPWLIPATVGGMSVITSDNAADAISIPQ